MLYLRYVKIWGGIMERVFSKIIRRSDARHLMKEAIENHRYNVNTPLPIENNYFIDQHYALFLVLDAFVKFDIIIEDMSFIEGYISQLQRILKRMTNYQDITKGIHQLICRVVGKKLEISNYKANESKEKILRYIYKKYVVEGYFYYGFSSIYRDEVTSSGIQRDGFFLDSRLCDLNEVFRKYGEDDVFRRLECHITDHFVIASYFSLLGPDYLEKFANSSVFRSSCYDKTCFYTKDAKVFRENLDLYTKNKHFNAEDKSCVINSLLDVWEEDHISGSHGCIAFIKRKDLQRNYLKNIEEIIEYCKNNEIETSALMIMESRYSSYEIEQSVSPSCYEIVDLPSYSYLIGLQEEDFFLEQENFEDLKISSKEGSSNSLLEKTSYGYASIFMLLGLLLISLGSTIMIVVTSLGR